MPDNNWFEWKGGRSTTYGIVLRNSPDIIIPQERVETVKVYGRSGTLTRLEGDDVREEMLVTIECYVPNLDNLASISSWLRGSGNLILGERSTRFYQARVNNQISFAKMLRIGSHRSFQIIFRCQPYAYHISEANIALTAAGTVTNPGSIASEPVITIVGSGAVTLTIGTQVVAISNVDGSVIIDTPRMECYKLTDGVASNKNSTMTGEFPVLKPGANAVSWTLGDDASLTSVTFTPNWRDL